MSTEMVRTLVAGAPYELLPQHKLMLKLLVKKSHKLCHGTGVVGWIENGQVAMLCICVRRNAATLEPQLEALEPKLKALTEKAWEAQRE